LPVGWVGEAIIGKKRESRRKGPPWGHKKSQIGQNAEKKIARTWGLHLAWRGTVMGKNASGAKTGLELWTNSAARNPYVDKGGENLSAKKNTA